MAAETIREYLVALGFKIDETGFRKFNSAVLKATEPVLKLGAAATGAALAIEVMVERVARRMEDLYYASQRTYATAESLREVGFAARQVGLEAGAGTNLLEGLGRALRMNPGTEGIIRSFGVQTREANGHLRDTRQVLDDLLPRLAAMPRYQALRYAGVFGIDPEALNQVLNNLPAFVQAQKDAAKSLRQFGVDQTQVSKDSVEFMRHLNALEQSFENLRIRIAHDWLKPAQQMIDQVNQLVIGFGELNNETEGWAGKIASLAGALGGFLGILKLIKRFMPGGGKAAAASSETTTVAEAAGGAAGAGFIASLLARIGPIGAFLATMAPTATQTEGPTKGLNFKAGSVAAIVDYFEKAGFSHAQAVGIATNLKVESGLNPTAVGDNGKAFGLAQWHADRQRRFEEMFGHSIRTASFGEQLQFIARELSTSESRAGALLHGAKTAREAAEIFARDYERPAGGAAEIARRGAAAVTLNQRTDIHVSGSTDATGTARRIADEQGRVNGDLVRNLGSVVR